VSWFFENYTKLHFWYPMRNKDKVENEQEVGYHSGFYLEDIECQETPFFL
jgi:hypothetical protein